MSNRYQNIKRLQTQEGRRFISNPIYPDIAPSGQDIYLITRAGDRFDKLAQEFYNDSSLWYIIASTNPEAFSGGLIPKIGVQIRVPANQNRILDAFQTFNEDR
jgi:hypothetical protein